MINMKAGSYYIGDCCYVLREEQHEGFDWVDGFCGEFWLSEDGSLEVLGEKICAFNTAWGDGCYEDQFGNDYPVDAGLIGVVPSHLWKGDEPPFGCHLVEFEDDFTCVAVDGLLKFGQIEIDTDPEEEEDEWEQE